MRIIFIALTISLSTLCFGQKFKVDTVYQSGSVESRINFVILPDGYTSQELVSLQRMFRNLSQPSLPRSLQTI
jgi:hypothetical protein